MEISKIYNNDNNDKNYKNDNMNYVQIEKVIPQKEEPKKYQNRPK
jgi:hypothetical protein